MLAPSERNGGDGGKHSNNGGCDSNGRTHSKDKAEKEETEEEEEPRHRARESLGLGAMFFGIERVGLSSRG